MERARTRDIREFILSRIDTHPCDVARMAAQEYGISRQAVNRHFQAMIAEGLLEATGRTRAREYHLVPTREITRRLDITPVVTEDRMWSEYIRPLTEDVSPNVRDICQCGFTEVANNVLEHSDAARVTVSAKRTATAIGVAVTDNGTGIFARLSEAFGFESAREAVFELSKGRLTTEPEKHTGGTLFLLSRMFDRFDIQSSDHTFSFRSDEELWSVVREPFAIHGTSVRMHVSLSSRRTLSDVLETWATPRGDLGRAHVPVELLADQGEAIVSRSQGRRLCRRLGQCSEAILDFRGVDTIGPGFADEVFRVFHQARPETALITLHANADVRRRIREALGAGSAPSAPPPAASTKEERPARS